MSCIIWTYKNGKLTPALLADGTTPADPRIKPELLVNTNSIPKPDVKVHVKGHEKKINPFSGNYDKRDRTDEEKALNVLRDTKKKFLIVGRKGYDIPDGYHLSNGHVVKKGSVWVDGFIYTKKG